MLVAISAQGHLIMWISQWRTSVSNNIICNSSVTIPPSPTPMKQNPFSLSIALCCIRLRNCASHTKKRERKNTIGIQALGVWTNKNTYTSSQFALQISATKLVLWFFFSHFIWEWTMKSFIRLFCGLDFHFKRKEFDLTKTRTAKLG